MSEVPPAGAPTSTRIGFPGPVPAAGACACAIPQQQSTAISAIAPRQNLRVVFMRLGRISLPPVERPPRAPRLVQRIEPVADPGSELARSADRVLDRRPLRAQERPCQLD